MSGDLGHDALRFSPEDELTEPRPVPAVTSRRGWWLGGVATVLVVVVFVGLASLFSGGRAAHGPSGSTSNELVGPRWSLVSITAAGSTWRAPTGNTFSLTFTDSGYTGSDSCNSTGGAASYGTGTITLAAGPMTAMGCLGDDRARMQEAFRQLIGKDLGVTVSGSTITLRDGPTVLVLAQAQPTPTTGATTSPGLSSQSVEQRLTTTTWTLQAVDGRAVTGWTLTMTATSYALKSLCVTHNGAVSYGAAVTMQATTTAGTCEAPVASAVVDKAANVVFSGAVDIAFPGDRMTLAKGASKLEFAASAATAGNASAAPAPSSPPQAGIAGMKATLIASTWSLRSLTTATDTWYAVPGSTGTLRFADSTYQVSNGCEGEGFSVSYDDATATVTFSRGGEATGMDCSLAKAPPEGTVPPQAFFDALLGPMRVALDGDAMTLTRGGVRLSFTRSSGGTSEAPSPGPAA